MLRIRYGFVYNNPEIPKLGMVQWCYHISDVSIFKHLQASSSHDPTWNFCPAPPRPEQWNSLHRRRQTAPNHCRSSPEAQRSEPGRWSWGRGEKWKTRCNSYGTRSKSWDVAEQLVIFWPQICTNHIHNYMIYIYIHTYTHLHRQTVQRHTMTYICLLILCLLSKFSLKYVDEPMGKLENLK